MQDNGQPDSSTDSSVQSQLGQFGDAKVIQPSSGEPSASTENIQSINTGATSNPVYADPPQTQQTPQQIQTIDTNLTGYSYSSFSKESGVKRSKQKLLIAGISAAVVILLFTIYFWILPTLWANSYLKNIKISYDQQAAKMTTVYQSFKRPVFTTENTSQVSDTRDLEYTQGVIKEGQSATTDLQKTNNLKLLPGMSLLPKASKALKEYKSVKNYISQSNTFLTNYQTAVVFMDRFEKLSLAQQPLILEAIKSIGASKSPSQLLANSKKASALIAKFLADLNSLHPSDDFRQLNSDFISDFSQLKSGIDGLIQGINTKNLTIFNDGAQQMDEANAKIDALEATNVINNLQHHSTLHQQISDLESQKLLN